MYVLKALYFYVRAVSCRNWFTSTDSTTLGYTMKGSHVVFSGFGSRKSEPEAAVDFWFDVFPVL